MYTLTKTHYFCQTYLVGLHFVLSKYLVLIHLCTIIILMLQMNSLSNLSNLTSIVCLC